MDQKKDEKDDQKKDEKDDQKKDEKDDQKKDGKDGQKKDLKSYQSRTRITDDPNHPIFTAYIKFTPKTTKTKKWRKAVHDELYSEKEKGKIPQAEPGQKILILKPKSDDHDQTSQVRSSDRKFSKVADPAKKVHGPPRPPPPPPSQQISSTNSEKRGSKIRQKVIYQFRKSMHKIGPNRHVAEDVSNYTPVQTREEYLFDDGQDESNKTVPPPVPTKATPWNKNRPPPPEILDPDVEKEYERKVNLILSDSGSDSENKLEELKKLDTINNIRLRPKDAARKRIMDRSLKYQELLAQGKYPYAMPEDFQDDSEQKMTSEDGEDGEDVEEDPEIRKRKETRKRMMNFYLKNISIKIHEPTDYRGEFSWLTSRVLAIFYYWVCLLTLVSLLGAIFSYVFRNLPPTYSTWILKDILYNNVQWASLPVIMAAISILSFLGVYTIVSPNPKLCLVSEFRWVLFLAVEIFLIVCFSMQIRQISGVHRIVESHMKADLHERESILRIVSQSYFRCCGVYGHKDWMEIMSWKNNTLDKGGFPTTCCNLVDLRACFPPVPKGIYQVKEIRVSRVVNGTVRVNSTETKIWRNIIWESSCLSSELKMIYCAFGLCALVQGFVITSSISFGIFMQSTVKMMNDVERLTGYKVYQQ